ncbi:hypothetical protein HJC99_03265 [Candidatus Saccharibacteria bacterium]|nr:hypothetical protein [Candidatus Saccharibacteria bacterium]
MLEPETAELTFEDYVEGSERRGLNALLCSGAVVMLGFLVFVLTQLAWLKATILSVWWVNVLIWAVLSLIAVWIILRARAEMEWINQDVDAFGRYDEAQPPAERLQVKYEWVPRKYTIRILLAKVADQKDRFEAITKLPVDNLILATRRKKIVMYAPIGGMIVFGGLVLWTTSWASVYLQNAVYNVMVTPPGDNTSANSFIDSLVAKAQSAAVSFSFDWHWLVGMAILLTAGVFLLRLAVRHVRRRGDARRAARSENAVREPHLGYWTISLLIALAASAIVVNLWHAIDVTQVYRNTFEGQSAPLHHVFSGLPSWFGIGVWVLVALYGVGAVLRWMSFVVALMTTSIQLVPLWPGWLFWVGRNPAILYVDRIDLNNYKQSVWGRIFRYCTLIIDSPAQKDRQFNHILGMPKPDVILATINSIVKARLLIQPPSI